MRELVEVMEVRKLFFVPLRCPTRERSPRPGLELGRSAVVGCCLTSSKPSPTFPPRSRLKELDWPVE